MYTDSPRNLNSLGSRTAWLWPFLKSFAVFMPREYILVRIDVKLEGSQEGSRARNARRAHWRGGRASGPHAIRAVFFARHARWRAGTRRAAEGTEDPRWMGADEMLEAERAREAAPE